MLPYECCSQHDAGLVRPDKPQDIRDALRMPVSVAREVARASGELRALLAAYARRFYRPRTVMADLARAQDASPQDPAKPGSGKRRRSGLAVE